MRALEAFFVDNPNAVIWLDLISTSQHATFDRPPEWWQKTFISAIGAMGQMVMVMTPWDNPICLKRAWCLIELYACRSSGAHFGVALPPSQRAQFLSEIVERSGAFYDMLSKVNTAKSECSRDADKDDIFAAVRRLDGGFTGLDRSVLKTVTEWLEQQLEEEIGRAVVTERVRDECNLIRALGGLFENKGEYNDALPLYEECLVKRKRILGDDHPDTLQSLHRVAVLFDRKGEHQRALPLYEECLAKRKRILGDDHPDTLQSLNDLAALFCRKGEHQRALPLYEECLAKRKRILGDDHPDTLGLLNDLAAMFDSKGEHQRALPLYEECLAKRKRILGDDHPDTLQSLNNLAVLFHSKGEHQRALPLYEECLAKRKRILGDDHPDTLRSLGSVETLFGHRDEARSRSPSPSLPNHFRCLSANRGY